MFLKRTCKYTSTRFSENEDAQREAMSSHYRVWIGNDEEAPNDLQHVFDPVLRLFECIVDGL